MKDLYARLGIEAGADREEIAAAARDKPELQAHASILLNPEKRALYDRTRVTLTRIGTLRHRLGLDTSGDTWFLRNSPDFAPQLRAIRTAGGKKSGEAAPSAADSTVAEAQQPERPERRPTRAKISLALIVIGAIAVIAILAYFLR